MTAPNLLTLTSVECGTVVQQLTTSEADVIAAVPTDHVYEVTAIFASNIHATVVALVTVILKRSGTDHVICNAARIPVKQIPTNVLAAGRTIYLQEGDSLRAFAQANSNAEVFVPFNDLWQSPTSP